jgi:hypothetical protein
VTIGGGNHLDEISRIKHVSAKPQATVVTDIAKMVKKIRKEFFQLTFCGER